MNNIIVLKERITNRLNTNKNKKIEIIGAMQTLLWGCWILYPAETFTTATAFKYLASIAPEYVWGFTMTIFGILQVMGVFLFSRNIRIALVVFSIFLWTTITVAYGFGNILSTAVPQALSAILAEMFSLDHVMKGDKI